MLELQFQYQAILKQLNAYSWGRETEAIQRERERERERGRERERERATERQYRKEIETYDIYALEKALDVVVTVHRSKQRKSQHLFSFPVYLIVQFCMPTLCDFIILNLSMKISTLL